MPRLPSDEAIRARAEERGLVSPGAVIDRVTRRSVAKDLLQEAVDAENAPKAPAGKPSVLPIAGIDVQLPGIGLLHLDVTLTPPKEN